MDRDKIERTQQVGDAPLGQEVQLWFASFAGAKSPDVRSARRSWAERILSEAGYASQSVLSPEGEGRAENRRWAATSASGMAAALAIATRPVAVDLEQIRVAVPGFAQRFLGHLITDSVPAGIWREWTLKEAVLKLMRSGLRIDPARVTFDARHICGTPRIVQLDGRTLPVRVWPVVVEPGFAAAVAIWLEQGSHVNS